jgi:hypothetical protein
MQEIKIQLEDGSLVSVMKVSEILFNFTALDHREAFRQAKQLCRGEAIIISNNAFLDILESLHKEFKMGLIATIVPEDTYDK